MDIFAENLKKMNEFKERFIEIFTSKQDTQNKLLDCVALLAEFTESHEQKLKAFENYIDKMHDLNKEVDDYLFLKIQHLEDSLAKIQTNNDYSLNRISASFNKKPIC